MFRLINVLIFIIGISCFNVLASEDFLDSTISSLLLEKISDDRVVLEHTYNSKTQAEKVKAKQRHITNIVLDQFDSKYLSYVASVRYNDNKEELIQGRYSVYLMVPVAARYIKFGDIIQESDLVAKKMSLNSLAKGYFTDSASIIGMQAKRYILAGNMFKTSEISSPVVIKNGDPVNIVYDSGLISLKTLGIAMGSGAIGDMVKVKNSSSGAFLLGQIVNKSTVKVGGDNE